jgi:hypothetical protein
MKIKYKKILLNYKDKNVSEYNNEIRINYDFKTPKSYIF